MSRLPNPFANGQSHSNRTPQRPQTPGFLLMTRAPTGSNTYGGPNSQTPSSGMENFIPFNNTGNSGNSGDNRRHDQGGLRPYNFNRGGSGGGGWHNNNSPRFAHPYQQSPGGRMSSPRGRHGFNNISGGGRYNANSFSTPRRQFNASPGSTGRFGHNSQRGRYDRSDKSYSDSRSGNPYYSGGRGGGDRFRGRGERGPISSIPVDKFISDSMVGDPWVEFCDYSESGIQVDEVNTVALSLEDSEIIIDSDTSALVENSVDEVISDNEIDSSPVHDTGSESPNIATSSTSEKDTGSDSGSDT